MARAEGDRRRQRGRRPAPGLLQLHPQCAVGVEGELVGEREHAAAEGWQQLSPAEERDDRQPEDGRVEARLELGREKG